MTIPRKCPICGKPRIAERHPFCSPRCRDRDLMQWFGEGYAIPGRPAPTPTGEPNDNDED